LNRKKIAELEALAKTIYDYWFVQFDFPDKNGKPYKSSGGKMVWNEQLKREIPDGWEVKRLPELAEYLFGYPFDSSLFNNTNIGFPIVRIRNVKDGITQDRTTESTNKDYIISNGDFLIGMDGYFDMNHWTGGDAYLVQRTCRIKAKEALYNGWLSLALYTPIKHLEKSLSGATLAHLGKLHLDEILLTLPTKSITEAALTLINTTIQRKVSLGVEVQKLAKQRDTLLPLLMNGQVEVK
jgi:type I restriction enzyme S subunit